MSRSTDESSALQKKIIRQVEFYFGDRNLRRDEFLREQIKKGDGWVPLSVLVTFNRLKQLSGDPAVVATALKGSEILKVSDDGSKVQRPSLPDLAQNGSAKQEQEKKTTQQDSSTIKGEKDATATDTKDETSPKRTKLEDNSNNTSEAVEQKTKQH